MERESEREREFILFVFPVPVTDLNEDIGCAMGHRPEPRHGGPILLSRYVLNQGCRKKFAVRTHLIFRGSMFHRFAQPLATLFANYDPFFEKVSSFSVKVFINGFKTV
jgi:hypothetical protein